MKRGISPFIISGIIVGLMVILSIVIILFKGEMVNSGNEDFVNFQEKLDQVCSESVALEFAVPCQSSAFLNFDVSNTGSVNLQGVLFTVYGLNNNYITQDNVILASGTKNTYKLNYAVGEKASKISVTPAIEIDGKVGGCSPSEYIVSQIRPTCSSGGGGGGSGGGGGGGGGGSSGDDTPSCVDVDGDGYGVNCALGSDCDDGNSSVWKLWNLYNDSDSDSHGTGTIEREYCYGDSSLSFTVYLTQNHLSSDNIDCNDNDNTVWQNVSLYFDMDLDYYGNLTYKSSICVGNIDNSLRDALRITRSSLTNDDCDDSNNLIYPGALETCGDGIDQDCVNGDLPCSCDNDGVCEFGETCGDCLADCEGFRADCNSNQLCAAYNDIGESVPTCKIVCLAGDTTAVCYTPECPGQGSVYSEINQQANEECILLGYEVCCEIPIALNSPIEYNMLNIILKKFFLF